ncbi:hypothetical protein MUN81_16210 [Hymenobacter sp. 5317J-9]|uniref:hypothetical protein n=1 Tax=Hymenobacter sp. 5317J-9 TaxID=2932250 RepID=UPI001FD6E5E6|nr:hypothetical protein [Hymenobacter sp. 5317J-9]UOQ96779.1 hypothetical protein MUN81_16210 [Hymenobacter sp. 5317J-9]
MQKSTTAEGTLAPALFDEYAAQWHSKISDLGNPDVTNYFANGTGGRLTYLTFSIQRVAELVSAVGVKYIKARFVLMPDASSGQYRFSLVLFAADQEDRRLTAYYLPDAPQDAPPTVGEPLPGGLAGLWQAAWAEASPLTSAMFTTSYGVLKGYNFDLKDFLTPLFTNDQPYDKQQVRVGMGLHSYITPDDQYTQTFGLMVRRFDPTGQESSGKLQSVADFEFFDLSTPCPPVI